MGVQSIIRAKGGTAERTVQLTDIVIQDIRVFPLFLPDKRWIKAVSEYYEELGLLLGAARADIALPMEFFVPDLWNTSIKLPSQECEIMLDMWNLGHDLARGLGYRRGSDGDDSIRHGLRGTVYVK